MSLSPKLKRGSRVALAGDSHVVGRVIGQLSDEVLHVRWEEPTDLAGEVEYMPVSELVQIFTTGGDQR